MWLAAYDAIPAESRHLDMHYGHLVLVKLHNGAFATPMCRSITTGRLYFKIFNFPYTSIFLELYHTKIVQVIKNLF